MSTPAEPPSTTTPGPDQTRWRPVEVAALTLYMLEVPDATPDQFKASGAAFNHYMVCARAAVDAYLAAADKLAERLIPPALRRGENNASAPTADDGLEWAVVELMGHQRTAGQVSEVELFGAKMLRIDTATSPPVTQFYSATAIYCVTPTTEDTARQVAARYQRPPVQPWELHPSVLPTTRVESGDEEPF